MEKHPEANNKLVIKNSWKFYGVCRPICVEGL